MKIFVLLFMLLNGRINYPLGGVGAGKNTFQFSGLSTGIPLPSFLSGWTSSGWPARAC